MSIRKYLSTAPLFDITRYESEEDFTQDCIAFEGAPKKHPYDPDKLLLIIKPFSSNTTFYEFRVKDIRHAENMPSIVTDSGSNLFMARLWIRRGSMGVKYEPFEVGDTIKYYHDSELLHQVLTDRE
ncbi:hypothetical protein B4O97_16395 [Marispirochaeta aestuarii]|jgi:inorganic pyrophosphatase|uniref:Inorganic pyrophosphatase Ppa n=1 Tax=Marispirochaeta aestuarii TaxID=1963862 RepID=A0A1Y1RV54_9SPIO|nr:hypothetical protein [Marispirochaeta aestuarii]ORC31842.1 hypothetical protein B4O97_16395 [Marispirochaeta aestuarii]